MYVFVDVMNLNGIVIKTIANIVVIVLSFIASKLIIFKIDNKQELSRRGFVMYQFLIIGAGLYGAVMAQKLQAAGKRVLVIDKRPHIAGNVFT